ncbi:MAG: hypothetical protein ACREBU_02585 [Nitrososphaera sp.]
MLFIKGATVKERANAALSSLQRSAQALSMLRSRLESRIGSVARTANKESCQELIRVLELVKSGELILGEMSEKLESARFLEDFIRIMDDAAKSFREIESDVQELAPMAEAALSEMHDAITSVSIGMMPEQKQLIDPTILEQASSVIQPGIDSTSSAIKVEAEKEKKENSAIQSDKVARELPLEAEGVAV